MTETSCPVIIKTRQQFIACVPPSIVGTFWARAQAAKGRSWVIGQQAGLLGGYASIPSAYIFQLVPVTSTTAGFFSLSPTGQATQQGAVYEETQPRSLAEANVIYAYELLSETPLDFTRDLAQKMGVRTDLPEVEMRAGAAIMLAGVTTQAGQLLPNAIDRARATAAPAGAGGDSEAAGRSLWEKFRSGWNKLWTHPGEWAQRVFITEPGKAVAWAGRQLMSVQRTGWVRWLIDPLGVMRQLGAFFQELGHAMIAGSITAFEEQVFAQENARHWYQVGAALAVAAPFLPPPFNVIAAGLAAVFTAAGITILKIYERAETIRDNEKAVAALDKRADLAEQAAKEAKAQAALVKTLEGAADADEAIRTALLAPDQAEEKSALDLRAAGILGFVALILWGLRG